MFRSRDPTNVTYDRGPSYTYRADAVRLSPVNKKSFVTAIYNRIAMDAASIDIRHIQRDEKGRFKEIVNSGLQNVFNVEANIDQTGRQFKQDLYLSLLDEGCVAVVPVIMDKDPDKHGNVDVINMRIGEIIEWKPESVKVRLYNEETGIKEDILLPKSDVAVIESPLYPVINEPNSTMQRLVRKMALLDAIDEQSGSGKLDMIIQLPYAVRNEIKRQEANIRMKLMEEQLNSNKFGIAYIDATEKVTQLNRPVENNLMEQIQYLTNTLYSQLGLTEEIMNGTATADVMSNYYNRTIEPLLSAVTDELRRKYLNEKSLKDGQDITSYRDPFKLVPVEKLAEMVDKLTRNEILTSNEVRQLIGYMPVDDPNADELRNKNLTDPNAKLKAKEDNKNSESDDSKEDNKINKTGG